MAIGTYPEAKIFIHQSYQAILKRPRDEDYPEEQARVKKIHKFCSEQFLHFPCLTEESHTLEKLKVLEERISHLMQNEEERLFQEILKKPTLDITVLETIGDTKRIAYNIQTGIFVKESSFFRKYLLDKCEVKELNFHFTYEEFAFVEGWVLYYQKPPIEWAKRVLLCADFFEIPNLMTACIEILIEFAQGLDPIQQEDTLTLINLLNETERYPHFSGLKNGYECEFSKHINHWLSQVDDPILFREKENQIKEVLDCPVALSLNNIKNCLAFHALLGIPIRSLSLAQCPHLPSSVLKIISQMKGLEELELSDNQLLSGSALKFLCDAPDLKSLSLRFINKKISASDFANIPLTLQELSIAGYWGITNECFSTFHNMEQLHSITIEDCKQINDDSIQMLPKNIVRITLVSCPNFTANLCAGIYELKKLQFLRLENLNITDLNFNIVPEIFFTELEIINCLIDESTCEKIATLKNLKKLVIEKCGLVTHEIIAKIKVMNPGLQVEWDNDQEEGSSSSKESDSDSEF